MPKTPLLEPSGWKSDGGGVSLEIGRTADGSEEEGETILCERAAGVSRGDARGVDGCESLGSRDWFVRFIFETVATGESFHNFILGSRDFVGRSKLTKLGGRSRVRVDAF